MAKIRLNQLAKEFGVESKEVVDAAKDMGMDVKTHASTVSDEEADKLRAKFGAKKPSAPAEEKKPAPAESKEEKKPAESTEKKPAAKPEEQVKRVAASDAPAAPKKKIIIVNNKPGKPQASGASSQPAKAYTGQAVKPYHAVVYLEYLSDFFIPGVDIDIVELSEQQLGYFTCF